MSLPRIYDMSRPSVVSFSVEKKIDDNKTNIIPFGTGVCIDKSGIILTAYHVIRKYIEEDNNNFLIVFTESKSNQATAMIVSPIRIIYNAHHDFALIEVTNKQIIDGKEETVIFPTIKLPKDSRVRVGEDIATIGFPLRTEFFPKSLPDLYKGIISRVDYSEKGNDELENIMLDINVNSGNSGGPVVKVENGELIGIIRSCHTSSEYVIKYDKNEIMNGESEFLQRTNMVDCIPWDQIKQLVNEMLKEHDI